MSEPYVGEIRMFAGNFAPRGWAFCDGQLLAVSQNDALFSLLGTIYGGDGRTTFGLPDLRGRVPMHQGTGAGLTHRSLGSKFGEENHTLTVNEIPSHTHSAQGSTNTGTITSNTGNVFATAGSNFYSSDTSSLVTMSASNIGSTGGNQSHINMMPFLGINYIIALVGIYPSRS